MDLTIVSLVFDASDPEALAAVLAKYVVVTRGAPGCRNIDLCASVSRPGRFVVIEKWESPETQRTHFDSVEVFALGAQHRRRAAGCDEPRDRARRHGHRVRRRDARRAGEASGDAGVVLSHQLSSVSIAFRSQAGEVS